jgi:hypothetical protein
MYIWKMMAMLMMNCWRLACARIRVKLLVTFPSFYFASFLLVIFLPLNTGHMIYRVAELLDVKLQK